LDSPKGETVVEAQHGKTLETVVHGLGGKSTTIGVEKSVKTSAFLKGGRRSCENIRK
jgi:hypothetical protein